jgi:hypothetical protein
MRLRRFSNYDYKVDPVGGVIQEMVKYVICWFPFPIDS